MFGRNRIPILVVLFTLILFTAACTSGVSEEGAAGTGPARNDDGYMDISVQQLNEMMADKDFTLVNVHIPYEGDIPDTDLSIAYNDLEPHLDQLPEEKDAPIVLYCRSGSMSTKAAETLVGLGYSNIMEVDGGMNAWRSAGYDLIVE
jgi:rhodanese-related sulfurtransferase